MTQTTFAPPPVVAPPAEDSSEAAGNRKPLVLVGGLVAALVLGGGGYFLLSGGSSSDDLGSGPLVLPHAARPAAKPAGKPAVANPAVKVPPTSTVPLGRDPFHALYIAPVTASTVSNAPATTTSNPSTTSVTPPTTTSTGTTTTAPSSYKLVMSRVSGSGTGATATFTVGGKLMVAKAGSVFGPTSEIKLLSLTNTAKGWVATLQVGDSEPFDAAKGEALYVR